MAFLLNYQAQGVSGKNEQSTQTLWRGAPEARGPMQLNRLHRLKAGPGGGHTHLWKQGWKRPTPVRRRLSQTHAVLKRSFQKGRCRCRGWKYGVLLDCPTTPHSISDPPTGPHACFCQMNRWFIVRRAQWHGCIFIPEMLFQKSGETLSRFVSKFFKTYFISSNNKRCFWSGFSFSYYTKRVYCN